MHYGSMIDSINRLLRRSGLHHSRNNVDEDFMRALSRAEDKKAGNPEFDPSLHDLREDNSFWLGCHDRSGDLVATVAARRIIPDSFVEACRSYRLWYGDKIRFTEPLDIVFGQHERMPNSNASFMGAGWVRPDWRGTGLSWALTRLGYFTAMERWRTDWVIAMVFAGIAQAMLPAATYGFPRSDLFATGYRVPGFSRQNLFLLTMNQQEASNLAISDDLFLRRHPHLTLDAGFGEHLRLMRHACGVDADGMPAIRQAS